MWQPQMEALSDRYNIIAWDIRGHGRSDSPDDLAFYSLRHAVADMLVILSACGVERAAIGGLSLGGLLSLAFHMAHPKRTTSLLLFDTGPGRRNAVPRCGGLSVRSEPHGFMHVRARILEQPDDEIIASLESIRVPTLVLCGELDERFRDASDFLASKIAGAEKVILEGATHLSNIDQPVAFNGAVRSFLDRLPQ